MKEKIKKIFRAFFFQISLIIVSIVLVGIITVIILFAALSFADKADLDSYSFIAAISAAVLFLTAIYIGFQALATKNLTSATKELASKTRIPDVDIGLISKEENGIKQTYISFHNLSSFMFWTWLEIKFYNTREDRGRKTSELTFYNITEQNSPLLLSPRQRYEFKIDNCILIERIKNIDSMNCGAIYATITCHYNTVASEYLGSDIKPFNILYGYGYTEKKWLVDNLGITFIPLIP